MRIVFILLLLTIFASIYDQRRRKIPNWVSGPLLLAGILAHAPGTLAVDFSSALLLLLWFFFDGKIGGGDLKFWLALLWAIPTSLGDTGSILLFAVLTVTASFQILLRRWRGEKMPPVDHAAAPAAWRAVVFMTLLTSLAWLELHYV